MKHEIHKLMFMSSSHVHGDTMSELRDSGRISLNPGVFSDPYEYGVHLTIDENAMKEAQEAGDDPIEYLDLDDVVRYALKHGCTHVRLDEDGPIYKDLATYE